MLSLLEEVGEIPFPPYIKSTTATALDYQTVFAKRNGSSQHPQQVYFTENQLRDLEGDKHAITFAWVTLHVGLGTFRPVQEEDIRQHVIHEEYCEYQRNSGSHTKSQRRGSQDYRFRHYCCKDIGEHGNHDENVVQYGKKTLLFLSILVTNSQY